MSRYLLNSAVITTPGWYCYRLVDVETAKKWISEGKYESTIGYVETAYALATLVGQKIQLNRKLVKMESGDEALVFRLTCRLGDPTLKGNLTPEFILQNCELGILRKLKDEPDLKDDEWVRKLRRKVEDKLRKSSAEEIIKIAGALGVKFEPKDYPVKF